MAAATGAGAAALPVRPGEKPWTEAELKKVRQQLEAEIAGLAAGIREAESAIADSASLMSATSPAISASSCWRSFFSSASVQGFSPGRTGRAAAPAPVAAAIICLPLRNSCLPGQSILNMGSHRRIFRRGGAPQTHVPLPPCIGYRVSLRKH